MSTVMGELREDERGRSKNSMKGQMRMDWKKAEIHASFERRRESLAKKERPMKSRIRPTGVGATIV